MKKALYIFWMLYLIEMLYIVWLTWPIPGYLVSLIWFIGYWVMYHLNEERVEMHKEFTAEAIKGWKDAIKYIKVLEDEIKKNEKEKA